MIHFTDAALDNYIKEDVPSIDLTTVLMGIGSKQGRLEYKSRETGIAACTEEGARMLQKLGISVEHLLPSGSPLDPGTTLLSGSGTADQLHMAWKVILNLLEYCCGIASHTDQMVKKARAVHPDIAVAVTRKFMPGTKELVIRSAIAGGALPHRLGLSETVLIFDQHRAFLDHEADQYPLIGRMKRDAPEKKILAETQTYENAARLIDAGADGVQFDKIPAELLQEWVPKLRALNPAVTLIAAGGVNLKNADLYAATGVDVLVTSALFHGKPLDIAAKMHRI